MGSELERDQVHVGESAFERFRENWRRIDHVRWLSGAPDQFQPETRH
jgi:hypothetical protein